MYVQQLLWFVQLINMVTLVRKKKIICRPAKRGIAFSNQQFIHGHEKSLNYWKTYIIDLLF